MRHFILAAVMAIAFEGRAQQCTVDWNEVHQQIDGFGGSSAFLTMTWTQAQANMFFSTNTGIGLSLLRMQIQPGGFTHANEIALAQMAQTLGARIWSTPWTPQASFKDNHSTNGGNFLSASNQAYANQLAGYVAKLTNSHIHLYALSIQNEPDAVVSYVSCTWTAQQYHDFVPYLYNALAASNVASTKIMLPESESWYGGTGFETTAMSDPTVAAQVGILANHNYDGVNFDTGPTSVPAVVETYGKSLWETEVSTGNGYDPSISNAVYWAGRIHLFMTVPQANAWHYWWLIPWGGTDNQGLTDSAGNPAKRMYAVGQFSRFVRPNYYRIDANVTQTAALISAYKDSVSPNFAIVAINPSSNAIAQTFFLSNFAAASVSPWLTSATASLAKQSPVTVADSAFTYQLPAMSVVTFAGQALGSNAGAVLTTVANQTINAGQTVVITNSTVAAPSPTETLTFNLSSGPTNATLGVSTGVFSWRPSVNQAGTTNLITVEVSDNATPSLSATNSFYVFVKPLTETVFSSISLQQGQVVLIITGASGPDFTLTTSTNLKDWQVLFTTNSPVSPVTLQATNANKPASFYRIQLGP